MKNVEEIGKLGARFASFFMAAQADASYSRSECFIEATVYLSGLV